MAWAWHGKGLYEWYGMCGVRGMAWQLNSPKYAWRGVSRDMEWHFGGEYGMVKKTIGMGGDEWYDGVAWQQGRHRA